MGVEEGDVVQSAKGFSLQDLLGSVARKRPASEGTDPPSADPAAEVRTEVSPDSAPRLKQILDVGTKSGDSQRARPEPNRPIAESQEPDPLEETTAWEMLSPLPRSNDPYVAFSRLSSRPVPTIFFLGGDMLPNGYANNGFERIYFEAGKTSGEGPVLVVRFHGSVVTEVRIEGRNLIPLATHIGRQLVQWVRERPPGIAEESEAMTVVTSITIGEVDPFAEN